MENLLACWVGKADLRASSEADSGLGPIAEAVAARSFSRILLLSNWGEEKSKSYSAWLSARTTAAVSLYQCELSGPTNFTEIYEIAKSAVSEAIAKSSNRPALTFHLSPGTPAMAAVWIILGKTRFPAELIESSLEQGVNTASFPFDISADFLPDLLRGPDDELERLSIGLAPEAPEFEEIIHRSKVMKQIIARARRVAPRSIPVLIEGESGTGKELFARAIHKTSPRRNRSFVVVNCGAIPAELVESELFGHEKGSFTGAMRQRIGLFEAADGGTLFLDEVGELPKPAQVKLLRALQEGEVLRVGATEPIKVDVRVISATNRSLINEIEVGDFREDLFYRLAVAVLKLPPLRERAGDLNLLIDKLLDQVNEESATEPGFEHKNISAGARNILLQYGWPGNVRELLNTLRRAAVWSSGNTIRVEDMREALLHLPKSDKTGDAVLGQPVDQGIDIQSIIAQVASHYLERALETANGNKTRAANLLGLSNYQTLNNWLNKYNVSR